MLPKGGGGGSTIVLCSSVEERRVMTRNVPGSVPGMTYFFYGYLFFVSDKIWVRSTDLRIEFVAAGGTPGS